MALPVEGEVGWADKLNADINSRATRAEVLAGFATKDRADISKVALRRNGPLTEDVPVFASPGTVDASFNQGYVILANTLPVDWPIDLGQGTTEIVSNVAYQSEPALNGVRLWRFCTDADEIAIRTSTNANTVRCRIFVDGAPTTEGTQDFGAGVIYSTIVFPTAKPRLIEIMASAGINSIYVKKPYRAWLPTEPRTGPRMLVVGDSYVLPNVWTDDGLAAACALDGLYQQIGPLIGVDDLWTEGIGSTGYIADNSGTQENFVTRLPGHAAIAPDILVVHSGGANDFVLESATTSEVEAAVIDYFTQARASLPDAKLVFVEGFAPAAPIFAGLNDEYVTVSANVRAALTDVGVYYIDVATTDPWLDGTGKITAPAGDGNCDAYIADDAIHYTITGGAYLRGRMAPKLRRILADDGSLLNTLI